VKQASSSPSILPLQFAQGKMKFATFIMLTTSALARPSKPVSSWPGWSGIEQMFVLYVLMSNI
jgi:hypothetical protein